MNVRYCSEVKNPGDWAFFRNGDHEFIKIMLPIPPVEAPIDVGEPRLIALPVSHGGWTWNHNEDAPTLEPSIKTEICVGWTQEAQPKPIMREIYHGHLENGKWRNG